MNGEIQKAWKEIKFEVDYMDLIYDVIKDGTDVPKGVIEEALLLKNGDRKPVLIAPKAFVEELKKVTAIAGPMVVVTLLQYLLRVAPMIMVGHISELSLSSVAIATSLTNVTGYSVLFGLSGALETLCGQAYGTEQY
ncbi:hypothetical protein RHSIM_Rhsim10G0075000 [Rhododendron simsii]|uniref:Uncharacterized protein n=1 Tax=Rhododendron simsii TaxID=118357 RepID=A0A834GEI9_RHOSS|nr:hypothetical protein RHSIM_Rhsim10G0075000 [Rhododendron simsii]